MRRIDQSFHSRASFVCSIGLFALAGIALSQGPSHANPQGIIIKKASYGDNCRGRGGAGSSPASHEQTRNLQAACAGQSVCRYAVDHNQLGDPAVGCAKNYSVTYACGAGVGGEASGQTLSLRCSSGTIRVTRAAYGLNCRGRGDASSNPAYHEQTPAVSAACNGQQSCDFYVDHSSLGDPAVGCAKDFRVQYDCVGAGAAAEASGKVITLSCSY